MLEYIPWREENTSQNVKGNGWLEEACCHYQSGDGITLYYDTQASIQRKLKHAEEYGCMGAFILYKDWLNIV